MKERTSSVNRHLTCGLHIVSRIEEEDKDLPSNYLPMWIKI